jgi:hypothetical protein
MKSAPTRFQTGLSQPWGTIPNSWIEFEAPTAFLGELYVVDNPAASLVPCGGRGCSSGTLRQFLVVSGVVSVVQRIWLEGVL